MFNGGKSNFYKSGNLFCLLFTLLAAILTSCQIEGLYLQQSKLKIIHGIAPNTTSEAKGVNAQLP